VPRDANLYGTGEVSLPSGLQLPRDGTIITLWARDMPSANPYANLYGSHPFYMQLSAGAIAVAGPCAAVLQCWKAAALGALDSLTAWPDTHDGDTG
jgi:hypothetical protein